MENKITTSGLAAMIALVTGQPGELCEAFLRELFRIIGDELERGESVRIKGLGTFKTVEVESRKSVDVTSGDGIEIPAHKKVIFVASKELAEIVNAPFEAFESVEVSDALPTDELLDMSDNAGFSQAYDSDSDVGSEEIIETEERIDDSRAETEEPPVAEKPLDPVLIQSEIGEKDDKAFSDDEEVSELSGAEEMREEYEEDEEEEKRGRFTVGFFSGFLSALVVVALVLFVCVRFEVIPKESLPFLTKKTVGKENIQSDNPAAGSAVSSDSAVKTKGSKATAEYDARKDTMPDVQFRDDPVPTLPSDEPVYDVVSTTRYLTTMAQEHYGNFNLWPIIYEENKAILGHPDRIKPGTQVVIPPLSKYKVDPDNPEDVKRLKEQGVAIYARFK